MKRDDLMDYPWTLAGQEVVPVTEPGAAPSEPTTVTEDDIVVEVADVEGAIMPIVPEGHIVVLKGLVDKLTLLPAEIIRLAQTWEAAHPAIAAALRGAVERCK